MVAGAWISFVQYPAGWGWLVVLALTVIFARVILNRMRGERKQTRPEQATQVTQSSNQSITTADALVEEHKAA